MSAPVLSRRALNRALLARQLLLTRQSMAAVDAVRHLVGLQAQSPEPPYVGLWSRLVGFDPAELSGLVEDRQVVRVALMRSTIHLVTAADCIGLRPLMQPALDRGLQATYGPRLAGVDADEVVRHGRELLARGPRTLGQLGAGLGAAFPGVDPDALAMLVRSRLSLVQVPPRGLWRRSGPAAHADADAWLAGRAAAPVAMRDVAVRYLAAFGPASVADLQKWSGLTRLRTVVQDMAADLVTFRDEHGTELVDLPDAARPGPDAVAPARLLAGFDNVLLSHAERSRIFGDTSQRLVMTPNGLVLGAVLVDGFVAGSWHLFRAGGPGRRLPASDGATPAGAGSWIVVRTVRPLRRAERAAVASEAEDLLAFTAGDSGPRDVRFEVSDVHATTLLGR